MRLTLITTAFLGVAYTVSALAGDLAALKGPAAGEVRSSLEHWQRDCPSDPDKKCSIASMTVDAKLFYGHFPDRDDHRSIAVLFLGEDTGGSGAAMEVFVWAAKAGEPFHYVGSTADAIGDDARNVRFRKGGIVEYTGTVMAEGDAHATPSGKKVFEIRVEDGHVYFRGPK